MQPALVPPISIYAGDTWSQSYEFKAGAPSEPIDFIADGILDWKCQLRPEPSSSQYVEISVDLSDAENGRIILSASAAETANFFSGVFDLQSTKDGEVKTWIRGNVSFVEDVTR